MYNKKISASMREHWKIPILRAQSLTLLHDIQGWIVGEYLRRLDVELKAYKAAAASGGGSTGNSPANPGVDDPNGNTGAGRGFGGGHDVSSEARVPSGYSTGGQWTRDGTNGGSRTDDGLAQLDNNISPSIDKAIQHLRSSAKPKSGGECATYVRIALNAGGIRLQKTTHAKNYGSSLVKAGFKPFARWHGQFNPAKLPASGYIPGYKPKSGDVAVIQPYIGGNQSGHMTMYDGKEWFSDFKQRSIWAGSGYRKYKPHYVIYRYPN